MNILLIEDSPIVVAMLREGLQQSGFNVEVRTSIADTRLRLRGGPPDVVLLDWLLVDGVADQLLLEICEAWPQTRLIITTALTAMELPPTPSSVYLLLKPFSVQTLVSVISRRLGGPGCRTT